jgi:hypothetical protein
MLKYLFCKQVPLYIMIQLLEKICIKTENAYIIDINAYKKMLFFHLNEPFCQSLQEYYHESKQYYLTREFTYKSFTNIIRQICKSNEHAFYTKIEYNHSVYTILFFISLAQISLDSTILE